MSAPKRPRKESGASRTTEQKITAYVARVKEVRRLAKAAPSLAVEDLEELPGGIFSPEQRLRLNAFLDAKLALDAFRERLLATDPAVVEWAEAFLAQPA